MSKRIYEFKCSKGHITESFVDSELRQAPCKECGEIAERIISTPMVSLDGCSGDFPGAYMKWEKKHKEKLAQEKKKNASYGVSHSAM